LRSSTISGLGLKHLCGPVLSRIASSGPGSGPNKCGRLFRNGPLGQAAAWRLDCCSFTVDPLGSRRIRPFTATMGSSDSRMGTFAQCGSLRFLGFSFPARCLQPPRGARWVRSSVSAIADFGFSGRVVTPFGVTRPNRVHLRCGSQASRASPWDRRDREHRDRLPCREPARTALSAKGCSVASTRSARRPDTPPPGNHLRAHDEPPSLRQ
jgi:hypothetical protein